MRRFVLLHVAAIVAVATAYAADDAVTRAMKLYDKRHYDEAVNALRGDVASIEPAKQGAAHLALGMAYFRNAVLHRELYRAAGSLTRDFLQTVSATRGKDRSRFVDLYLGHALMETGKPSLAAASLEKFSRTARVEPRYRAMARVSLGLSYYLSNAPARAASLWATVDTADPEVKAELAWAYSRAGLAGKNPARMADESLAGVDGSGKPLSMRLVKNLIAVYARAKLTEKGLELLRRVDLNAYSYREVLGKSKAINFYDLSLLGDMATLYGQSSVAALERAATDPKTRDAAEFYLGQAYALFGTLDQSAKLTAAFIAASKMPQQYKDRIRVWEGANLYQKKRRAEAEAVWDHLVRKRPEDPDLLAEVLFACSRLKAECPRILDAAAAAAAAGDRRKFANLNFALGRYYLGRLDYTRALSYLEAGRDKSNKNKIEFNDPVMLVDLAEAYYQTKKFSEGLEIYFEMSKQFPQVRQLQEAMQGVYAVEQKSAGDVKIN